MIQLLGTMMAAAETSAMQNWVVLLVGGGGLLWYLFCVFYLGWNPPIAGTPVVQFRQFMSFSVSTISASLATFVGMVVGLESAAGPVENATDASRSILAATSLQWWCAGLYLVSLILALWLWWRQKAQNPDEVIVALGKSFVGLVVGALAIVLNTST
jgi:hypothetical protein